ncbi:MAG: phage tail protein [Spirochaetota bacterium]
MSNIILREEKGSPLTHEELDQNFKSIIPPGTILTYSAEIPPDGYLICDGSELARDVYSNLFNIIGELYGSGDDVSTFNIPDLRGEFIRGFDNGKGVDVDREIGSYQEGTKHVWISGNTNNYLYFPRDSVAVKPVNYEEVENGSKHRLAHETAITGTASATQTLYKSRPRNIALNYIIKY